MEQRNLSQHFDALQDQILSIYEEESTDLATQLRHWQLVRRSMAIMYYARKHGIKRLGLQPTPAMSVSEAEGKKAIEMTLLISSLMESPFANESWTLQDTSAELVLYTAPQRTFKKLPYTVDVLFDNDPENVMQYINYTLIYTRDENEFWYKTEGKTDYNGLYFEDADGNKAYFKLFATDAQTYGTTGQWTVHVNDRILSPPASSSRPSAGSSTGIIIIDSDEESTAPAEAPYTDNGDQEVNRIQSSQQPPQEAAGRGGGPAERPEEAGVRRQRQQQGERRSPPVKRAKADSSSSERRRGARGGGTGSGGGRGRGGRGGESPVPASSVGERHHTVTERHLSKLARLQAEARDPPIISVKGPPNCLKCWRYRLKRHSDLYQDSSTVFKWILKNAHGASSGHMLISFKSISQRQSFMSIVTIPKHCSVSFGNLDAL